MKKNKLVALICQNFADCVACCDGYDDYYSLEDALRIVRVELGENISRLDIEGWSNPHLDMIAENWEG